MTETLRANSTQKKKNEFHELTECTTLKKNLCLKNNV